VQILLSGTLVILSNMYITLTLYVPIYNSFSQFDPYIILSIYVVCTQNILILF